MAMDAVMFRKMRKEGKYHSLSTYLSRTVLNGRKFLPWRFCLLLCSALLSLFSRWGISCPGRWSKWVKNHTCWVAMLRFEPRSLSSKLSYRFERGLISHRLFSVGTGTFLQPILSEHLLRVDHCYGKMANGAFWKRVKPRENGIVLTTLSGLPTSEVVTEKGTNLSSHFLFTFFPYIIRQGFNQHSEPAASERRVTNRKQWKVLYCYP